MQLAYGLHLRVARPQGLGLFCKVAGRARLGSQPLQACLLAFGELHPGFK